MNETYLMIVGLLFVALLLWLDHRGAEEFGRPT